MNRSAAIVARLPFKIDASMPSVLIDNLPDDGHAGLQRRAEAAGQSLQQYLSREFARAARTVPRSAAFVFRIASTPPCVTVEVAPRDALTDALNHHLTEDVTQHLTDALNHHLTEDVADDHTGEGRSSP